MITLAIILIAWAILKKIQQKKLAQRRAQAYIPAAEIQRSQKEREKAQREAERAEAKRQREAARVKKETQARQQAEADKVFLVDQLDKLYEMLWDADAELAAARKVCQHDADMNKSGAVIADKVAAKHRAERDKLARRVMQIENAIHAKETKLNKAQQLTS